MDINELKTLWQMLQEVVEDQDYYYSLHEFLLESTEEERKEVEKELTERDYKQFYEYMDSFSFVNKTEINMAVNEYLEYVNNRPLCMGEMWDVSEVVDDYITTRWLENLDEE